MKTASMLIALTISAGLAQTALAQRQVLATRNALTAYLTECAQTTIIEVESPEGAAFVDEYGDFGTVLRSLKFIVPQACAEAEKVVVKGMAEGEIWYVGATTADDYWVFKGLYAPPADNPH